MMSVCSACSWSIDSIVNKGAWQATVRTQTDASLMGLGCRCGHSIHWSQSGRRQEELITSLHHLTHQRTVLMWELPLIKCRSWNTSYFLSSRNVLDRRPSPAVGGETGCYSKIQDVRKPSRFRKAQVYKAHFIFIGTFSIASPPRQLGTAFSAGKPEP